jgi:predicted DNA-binding transcriptional regulator AlpA
MNQDHGSSHLPPDVNRQPGPLTAPASANEPLPSTGTTMPGDRLIGIAEIRMMFGLGRTAAYELTHRPGFPAPIRISARCYRWWAAEVAVFAAGLRQQARPVARHRSAHAQQVPERHITGKVRMARRRNEPS